jgi:hypothetical protein
VRVFLIHVRDPQFYAIPAKRRSKDGRLRVMGSPPLGIMTLSAVLKKAGHEVVLFDQANPDTPTAVIIQERRSCGDSCSTGSFTILSRRSPCCDGSSGTCRSGTYSTCW